MLWEKNQKKEVFFTEEAADKQLLAAIEKELSAQKYQTFSNLCKQALWQFLYVSSSSELAQPASSLQRLEHKIYENLAQKFAELEKTLSARESINQPIEINQLNELENHLNKLTQKLTQIQFNIDAKLVETLEGFKTELPKIEATIKTQTELTIKSALKSELAQLEFTPTEPQKVEKANENDDLSVKEVAESVPEEDPLLQRLSPFLEDF
ncbi:MAG: hypothetical protein QNJ68_20145 [Microcoleaceae cyanobacterium MO_207.B10]|nr:hypothetical protein [Microcoleaceae cyanobacterium MO_207.B10]